MRFFRDSDMFPTPDLLSMSKFFFTRTIPRSSIRDHGRLQQIAQRDLHQPPYYISHYFQEEELSTATSGVPQAIASSGGRILTLLYCSISYKRLFQDFLDCHEQLFESRKIHAVKRSFFPQYSLSKFHLR